MVSKPNNHDKGRPLPQLSPDGEVRRREREARLAEALRANLRRRKADLDTRGGADAAPGPASAAQPGPDPECHRAAPCAGNRGTPSGDKGG